MAQHDLNGFLQQWREHLQRELAANESGFLSRRYPSIAKQVTPFFPKVDVILAYSNPITSLLPLHSNHPACNLQHRAIAVSRLASLCDLYFKWGDEGLDALIAKFRKIVWPGFVTRLMLMERDTVRYRLSHTNLSFILM